MKTIYISKSKVGNPDELMCLRHHLDSLDCKVVEFMGGAYNTTLLDSADILIVLPPGHCVVGKGQYTEVERFIDDNKWDEAWLVDYVDNSELQLTRITGYDEIHPDKQNWQNKFGTIQTEDVCYDLEDFSLNHGISDKKQTTKGEDINLLLASIAKQC